MEANGSFSWLSCAYSGGTCASFVIKSCKLGNPCTEVHVDFLSGDVGGLLNVAGGVCF